MVRNFLSFRPLLSLATAFVLFSANLFAQNAAKLDNSETLFTVLTAINACGYDAELATSDQLRMTIRREVGTNIENSETAKGAADSVCAFYRDHQQGSDARTLSPYVSLALYLNPPPAFAPTVKEADLPPDAGGVLGLVPLLSKFYADAGIHDIWMRHSAAYAEFNGRYRDALSKMIQDTELYLKLPSSSYQGRGFTVYLEPMGAPSETNARSYATEYYVVVTPGTNPNLKMDLIRHAYLHFLLDPMVGKFAANLAGLEPLLDALKLAPMDENFKEDPSLLVTECVIHALLLRTTVAV